MKVPSNEMEWVGVSRDFERIYNFPNCIGIAIPSIQLLIIILFFY